ncbi:MAG: hypothetical protein G8345_21325, partial [Magnetococcales bacterium]|nr:hypothetical protein [Magnetococcales bacterium]
MLAMTNPLLDTIEVLRHIDSYSLQWLVNHPSIHCDDLSRALFSARRDLQLYVLACLNRIRRPVVGEPVERHLGWMKVGSEKALRRQEEASGKVGRRVASIIQQLASQNGISIMDTPFLTAEVADRLPQNWREIPIPKAGYLPDKQQFCLESAMPGDKAILPVPDFDLRNACQEELIRFGHRLAWGVRVDGPAMLDAIHAHLSDPF